MTKHLVFCLLIISFCLFAESLNSQSTNSKAGTTKVKSHHTYKNAINMCPGGIAFGIFSMNYERLISPHHGLVGRIDYEAIPKSYSDASIEPYGVAFIANYRWHISGELKSPFVGAYVRYRQYKGEGSLESTAFDFSIPEWTVGANLGKRWVWDSGFNLTFALGYGISSEKTKADPSNNAIEESIDIFKDKYDFLGPFLGEFSIGYAF